MANGVEGGMGLVWGEKKTITSEEAEIFAPFKLNGGLMIRTAAEEKIKTGRESCKRKKKEKIRRKSEQQRKRKFIEAMDG